jgi:hypothetical protein
MKRRFYVTPLSAALCLSLLSPVVCLLQYYVLAANIETYSMPSFGGK